MLGQKVPYQVAQAALSSNKNRIFQKRPNDVSSGFDRIHTGDFPSISKAPKFKLSQSGKVFTIGSCFARNIELFLSRMGADCLTIKHVVPDEFYELKGVGARNGALNAYTAHSMRELVNIHTKPNKERIGALSVSENEWFDMIVSGIGSLNEQALDQVRGIILNAYSELPAADTVIITLGYTESWYDEHDEIFVNRSPAGSMKTARKASRYSFFNASFVDVQEALEDIVRSIREQTSNRAKIILTVSPVPIHATFTSNDVVSANLYSKSTLVSAAHYTASKYDFVDYFPSYELVTFSDSSIVWEADGIHVKPALVKKVIEQFSSLYFDSEVEG